MIALFSNMNEPKEEAYTEMSKWCVSGLVLKLSNTSLCNFTWKYYPLLCSLVEGLVALWYNFLQLVCDIYALLPDTSDFSMNYFFSELCLPILLPQPNCCLLSNGMNIVNCGLLILQTVIFELPTSISFSLSVVSTWRYMKQVVSSAFSFLFPQFL